MARLFGFAALLCCAVVWSRIDLDHMQSLALSRYGPDAASTVAEWRALAEEIGTLPESRKLAMVNDFFNSRIHWVTDSEAWGKDDYWATPLETMGTGMGDCEDFAIAKYVTLVLAGVDVSKLRITYVKAQIGGNNAAHMVLAYYPEPSADPQILDNLKLEIHPASWRNDLTPVYGFNSVGLWIGGRARAATFDPTAKLSRWRDLLRRASDEGMG
jgi:predicted transglutaminase-like cysteine proteinase